MITPLPTPPSRTSPSTFANLADAFLGALPTFATEANALQTDVNAKQILANDAAAASEISAVASLAHSQQAAADRVLATAARDLAQISATSASASEIAASKLNLGNKTTPPTVDNQGAALLAGATYYDTTLNKWRVWTGSAWGDGISAVAGVTSINGLTGVVSLEVPTLSQLHAIALYF